MNTRKEDNMSDLEITNLKKHNAAMKEKRKSLIIAFNEAMRLINTMKLTDEQELEIVNARELEQELKHGIKMH